jgi:hypothetical protein
MTTIQLLDILNQNKNISLDDLLKKMPDLTFKGFIETLMIDRKITKSELIKRTTLDRTYAYQIFNASKKPSQDKVIQLSLALQLNIHDTNILLTLSDNKSLYPKIKRDALIILCLNRHYSVIETNELLDEYHFKILD